MNLDNFKRLDLKKKIMLSIAAVALFVAGISYLVIYPTIRDIKDMSANIDAQRTDLEKKYVRGQSLNKLANNLKKVEPKMELLDKIFINQNRALEFITTLEEVASSNNVEQKINLMTDRSDKIFEFTRTPLQITLTGSFNNVMAYLIKIESLNYYININNIDMVKAGNGQDGGPQVSAQIMSNTYWR